MLFKFYHSAGFMCITVFCKKQGRILSDLIAAQLIQYTILISEVKEFFNKTKPGTNKLARQLRPIQLIFLIKFIAVICESHNSLVTLKMTVLLQGLCQINLLVQCGATASKVLQFPPISDLAPKTISFLQLKGRPSELLKHH